MMSVGVLIAGIWSTQSLFACRGMKRIAQTDQPGDPSLVGDQARNPPAQRLAADHQSLWSELLDDLQRSRATQAQDPAAPTSRSYVGLLCKKLESDYTNAPLSQFLGKEVHERRFHGTPAPCAKAMVHSAPLGPLAVHRT